MKCLAVAKVKADGEQVSVATGFSMSANRMPVTGSDSIGGVSPAVLLLLLGIGLWLGRRRPRSSPSL
jgi:LPXTG-motif cell wall-anchored protein